MKKPGTTRILGVNIAITNMQDATEYILSQIDQIRGKYICLSNVHTTVMSKKDPDYCRVQNDAFLALPDGSPLALIERLRGYTSAKQVAGPDLMPAIWKATENTELSHYFYGSSPETIQALEQKLRANYPGLKLAGMESPPYRSLTEEEDEEVIRRINDSGADFVWVGLGAPKQENWMKAHENRIHAVMLGVGAGFDFHAGTVRRAPKWMREHYLEWLYRLLQDPRRLWKRYVCTNFQFVLYSIKDTFFWRKEDDEEKKRILFYTHYYDEAVDKIVSGYSEDYAVTVICAVPSEDGRVARHYKQHKFYPENRDGVNFLRVRVPEFRKEFALSRRYNKLVFAWNAFCATLRVGKQDFVYATALPDDITAILGVVGSRLKKCKLLLAMSDDRNETESFWTHRLVDRINQFSRTKADEIR